MITFNYYGHACFMLDTGHEKLLFDPFLTFNTQAKIKPEDVECDYILVSHAHEDHFSDALKIAKKNHPMLIAIPEIINLFPAGYDNVHGMNLGGSAHFSFGTVTMVPALHSSGVAGGTACGFVIHFNDDTVVYYSGDTALFSDMKLIGERQKIHYAILPIGDNFTMGIEDAAKAVQFLRPSYVIPIHYNTWPIIEQEPETFKAYTESIARSFVKIVKPGHSLELEFMHK